MPDTGNKPSKVLSKMLDRLFAGLMSGPGMNCRPHNSRQRVDLTQLARMKDQSPEQVLRQLLGSEAEATIVARVKAPRKSDARSESDPDDDTVAGDGDNDDATVSPQQRAWDEQATLLNKIRVVADDARTYEQDTGVHVLNVGFPLLSLPPGTFSTGARSAGKRILAPIAFIPVTVALKRGASPTIELACRGEGVDRVMPNTALLAWLEQQTGKQQTAELFADDEGAEPWREVCELVASVAKALHLDMPEVFKIAPAPSRSGRLEEPEGAPDVPALSPDAQNENSPASDAKDASPIDEKAEPARALLVVPDSLVLASAPRADADEELPAILTSAILGLFPMANQGLLRDTQAMLAQTADPDAPALGGPVESFLTAGIDFDEPPEPPGDQAVRPAQQKVRRLFVAERMAASADPCQGRAVALARTARGLVMHGPPGTGKSQTITNVIADHLSRGQRVLLVCEKRTALDVVADRLEHMGLGQLCGIVHDPQRDQRDLYRSVRQQLDELNEARLHPQAETQLEKVDGELQKLHEELTQYHHALMTPPTDGDFSFHELMGRWMASHADPAVRVNDAAAQTIEPQDLEAAEPALLDVLNRAQQIDFARNPWSRCAGVAIGDFLSRPMDAVRTALERCAAAASAADATIAAAIPPFSHKMPLPVQGQARAELAERLAALLPQLSPGSLTPWVAQDAAALRAAQQRLAAMNADVQTFRTGPLDADLRAAAVDPLRRASLIPQQLRDLDAYLEVAGKWYAFASFGAKSEATKVLQQYGLPLTVNEAARLKTFLISLRARLVIHQAREELSSTVSAPVSNEGTAALPVDEVLERFLSNHAELFDVLIRLREDPALEGLAPLAVKALPDRAASDTFLDGLRKSPARAETITKLEDAMTASVLFDPAWLTAVGSKLRDGQPASATVMALVDRLDSLEGVLRVRQARAGLPAKIGAAADEALSQSAEPAAALAVLRRAVLAGEITRRLRADPQLQSVDAHRIESSFERYRELEERKKKLVREAIQHRWISRQKDRLLSTAGNKMNALGASTSRRFLMSGPRSLRLRQVIAGGERIEGGDPLFDLCPVWMASPETVAQIFPRKPLFDVVVFDEASQCRLEEALPVLTRGQRVLIAGDPKQLPPTRFFKSAFTQSDDDSEPLDEQELFESQQAEVEDLLGAALNLAIDQCYLDVHYRSRNADLIGFSNVNFYNNRLQAIPSHPSNRLKFSPLALYRVDGNYSNRRNEPEAARVVQIVADLLKRDEPPSIGIACFNLQQRDLIVEKLEELAAEDSDFGKKIAAARTRKGAGSFEGLFVKNLENVQGDERDHIIISTTYGPDARGKFYRRFGPLGRAGGGRRLNVLVTRARHEVHLVTSIPAEAYRSLPPVPEGQSAGGAWLLFAYLKYAEDLAATYESTSEGATPLAASQIDDPASAKPQAAGGVNVRATKSPSLFSQELAETMARQQHIGSDVHWGNEGFCVDLALHHPNRPGDVMVGVLCDSCRYTAADDPVEWDIFRTGVLADQGWQLRRVWTPHFFRDPGGTIGAIMRDAAAFVAGEKTAEAVSSGGAEKT